MAWRDLAWQAWFGLLSQGKVWSVEARFFQGRQGEVWRGEDGLGKAGLVSSLMAR